MSWYVHCCGKAASCQNSSKGLMPQCGGDVATQGAGGLPRWPRPHWCEPPPGWEWNKTLQRTVPPPPPTPPADETPGSDERVRVIEDEPQPVEEVAVPESELGREEEPAQGEDRPMGDGTERVRSVPHPHSLQLQRDAEMAAGAQGAAAKAKTRGPG
eukprot:Hpha_TRINITY_DN30374_c0_g1::TRINITY_DN30374_c0_g1_i1::g.147070::m.147070